MFSIFSIIESAITNLLSGYVIHPISILAGGVGIMAGSIVTVWAIYRSYLVMAGLVAEPLMPILKDFFIKIVIISIASSSGIVTTYVVDTLQGTQTELASALGGQNESSVFLTIEKNITEIILAMDTLGAGGTPPESDYELFQKNGEDIPAWVMGMAWIKDKITATKDAIVNTFDIFSMFMQFIYIAIVAIGLAFLGILSFFTIITNKFFFIVCLSVAPLFIFFSAFDFSRGWFSSWLNTTLGYGLAYPTVMLAVKGIFSIFEQIFSFGNLTFAAALGCFLICIIFSLIIARIGDISSSWFSAGNISDGTNALLAAAGYKSVGRVNRLNQRLRQTRRDKSSLEEGKSK